MGFNPKFLIPITKKFISQDNEYPQASLENKLQKPKLQTSLSNKKKATSTMIVQT